jgi:DNA-binding CsgD family transcriptional regulator
MAERPLLTPTLTARENDILQSIGRSLTVRQTARLLGIAVKTVENTQGHLFRKLGVHNRTEALTTGYSLGLLEPGVVRRSRTTDQLVAAGALPTIALPRTVAAGRAVAARTPSRGLDEPFEGIEANR